MESRLRLRTALTGSTLFSLTWKERATPSGRRICALRGSVRRTSGSASTSRPSPMVNDSKGSGYSYANGDHDRPCLKLTGAAALASWPTPQAAAPERETPRSKVDEEKRDPEARGSYRVELQDAAKLASWPTPRSEDGVGTRTDIGVELERSRSIGGIDLATTVKAASWPTPNAAGAERSGQEKRADGQRSNLIDSVKQAAWPTPMKSDADRGSLVMPRRGDNLTSLGAARQASWATPSASEAGGTPEAFLARKEACQSPIGVSLTSLSLQAILASWAMPAARDYKSDRGVQTDEELYGSKGRPLPRQALAVDLGPGPGGTPVETVREGSSSDQLNPAFTLWLQGYPAAWVSSAAPAIASSRRSRRSSSRPSSSTSAKGASRESHAGGPPVRAAKIQTRKEPPPIPVDESPIRPFVKWAGGKGQLLEAYKPLLPSAFGRYHEPFVGGGALFFSIRPACARISDLNDELINAYKVVRQNVEDLIEILEDHGLKHSEEHFYAVRSQDPGAMTEIGRAARFLYLNRTCFNGLYRVNRKGAFNVPFGRYTNPRICDEDNLRAVSASLAGTTIANTPFEAVLDHARAGDFVYFDPPYDVVSKTANFTSFTAEPFGWPKQEELAGVVVTLANRGVKVMVSNADTPRIRELYSNFDVTTVLARRAINSSAAKRGLISELVIRSYG